MKFVFLLGFMGAVFRTVCNQNKTEYGYEGETLMLICPFHVTEEKQTLWFGQPSNTVYFINAKKNNGIPRAIRLSVEKNDETNAYDLLISNFDKLEDIGNYSCLVKSDPIQQYFYNVELRIDVQNVTLNPSEIFFTIREGAQRNISCEVNHSAVPAPNISWSIGSNLTSAVVTYKSNIVVTGKKEDNNKQLQCRASNNNKSPKTASTTLYVEYPPVVNTLSQQDIKEGENLSVTCTVTPGNPSSATYYWTKVDNTGFRQNGPTLQLPNMQRTSSGTYRCTAENNYSNGEKGTNSRSMVVNVLYPPVVNTLSQQVIKEGDSLSIPCTIATPGNPRTTTFYWTKVDNPGFRQNETILQLPNIQRTSAGTYRCTAENNYSNGEKGSGSQSMVVNVLYSPVVHALSQQDIIEGRDLLVNCTATPGNPSSTTYYWTKVDNTRFRQNGSTLHIPSIQRTNSGTYRCTAENIFTNGFKGSHSQSVEVNVFYPPVVITLPQHDIIEGRNSSVTCQATPGNPNSTTFYWTKVDNTGNRQNGPTLQLPNIQRTSAGRYSCTAENSYINGEKGTNSEFLVVNVLYPPVVSTVSQPHILEGEDLSVTCTATPGNPNSTTFYWTKVDNTGFRQNGSTLHIPSIQRTSSGTYRCTAENIFTNGLKGSHSQSVEVNVFYKPEIVMNNTTIVNESEQVTLVRQIISNPLSNISWYNGSDLLETRWLVTNATFTIKKATCTDTTNFTLVASNSVQKNVTALVELIVNCKPWSYKTNFTLGITDTTGIDFSTIVIAYPEPSIKLEYENGTESDQMMKSINRNAVNKFTIHISQAVVNQSDFGVYHLKVWNLFGKITVIVNVIPQRKPNMPGNIAIVCEETHAKVQWKSSFNGGDPQLFTVISSSGQQSNNISDKGENVVHSTLVQHLQPSTMYVFYVSAQNSHGFISSEKISCTTLAESSEKLPIIVGSAAAGGLTLVVVVVVIVFLFRRFTSTEKQAGKSQRFENDLVENESIDDDGLKDNILYVSADPRENEKHEAAVYAAVNKKEPMSSNNSNVYAEVKKNEKKDVKEGAIYSDVKPKKGFFKKDGKVKKEKRQKRKQEVADVYENSDDIAMTANPDNVYSNTNHNKVSAKEQRGYKNKDGLLYVEVQFDTKTEDKNPVIHGDDEKTDYATVEFPVPSSSHDRE